MVATLRACRPPTGRGPERERRTRRAWWTEVEAVGVDGLDDAARLVAGPRGRAAERARRRAPLRVSGAGVDGATGSAPARRRPGPPAAGDLADVRGQAQARWALEVALAGGHNLLLIGPPGAGKTLLARTIPGLLPPLDDTRRRRSR